MSSFLIILKVLTISILTLIVMPWIFNTLFEEILFHIIYKYQSMSFHNSNFCKKCNRKIYFKRFYCWGARIPVPFVFKTRNMSELYCSQCSFILFSIESSNSDSSWILFFFSSPSYRNEIHKSPGGKKGKNPISNLYYLWIKSCVFANCRMYYLLLKQP